MLQRNRIRVLAGALALVVAGGVSVADSTPITFTWKGLTPDRKAVHFRVAIHSKKPVDQVYLEVRYVDDAGAVLFGGELIWQNIVHSVRQPIVDGKTYEVDTLFVPKTARADGKLLRVHFADSSIWEAPAH